MVQKETAYTLLKRLSTGMQLLLLSVIALAALGLLWWAESTSGATKSFLSAVGTGLLTSALFGLAQALITGRVTTELLRASVVNEVSSSLSASNRNFFPTHDFPASSVPDPSFNGILESDLEDSSHYWFRGLSARYTATRLLLHGSASLQAHLILPDPQTPLSIAGRVDYEDRHGLRAGMTYNQVRDAVAKEVATGLVGLFRARTRCAGIRLILVSTPSLDRFEIFRDSIWITLFSDRASDKRFPRSLRFSGQSVLYRMQEAECAQIASHPSSRIVDIDRRWNDSHLAAFLTDALGRAVSDSERADLISANDEFVRSYRRIPRTGGQR
ncbi:hypothetical protein [Cryptosporangium aurantiacum]|uniref:Uncharacterized protein n=1 Tax=Cryptosporangium aurantiacum TaxID=134849 RepID=A0A1M7RDZ0_9ACTN|nr:hypothetical protein [Cryptosporangium aurantiacum]SHN44430.1 hypothetical protein SAMN05443668_110207 [Cryptosporangium aurantiacum]